MLSPSLLKTDKLQLKTGIQSLKDNLSPKPVNNDMFGPSSPRLQPSSPTQGPSSNITNALEYAINAPTVFQKCNELGVVLDKCPPKDLATAYLRILEKVFSLNNGGRGFGVSSILRSSQPREFIALSDFLGSVGPLMRAGSKLLADPYLRFDFPISLLSQSTQQQIETGTASQFITSKLGPQNSSILLLNSFEFYMFTFAAYLVQPYTVDNKFVAGESLYPQILEDYFSYFLPCDGSVPPLSPLPFSLNVSAAAPAATEAPAPSPTRKSLLRQGSLLATPTRISDVKPSHGSSQEVWRSETLVNIFSELWLSPFSLPTKAKSESPSLNQKTSDIIIAVGDTLRIVRMMIKHLHYFSNSGGPLDVTPLDNLKRCVLQNIKKRIYLLFKYIFSHWPHDSSFRLVLETWLSYIQPWRYTDGAMRNRTTVVDEGSTVNVQQKWQNFVAENILFYTNILRLLLPRFFRMDLTASKNAQMLFRIAKIYSQPGLSELVRNGEGGLDRIMAAVDFSLDRSGFNDMPQLLNNIEVSESVMWSARQCLFELEGPGTRYEPIFGNAFRQTVSEILTLASRAKAVAKDSLSQANKEVKETEGFVSSLLELLAGSGVPPQNSSEVEEFRKTVQFLTQAVGSLATVFSLQLPQQPDTSSRHVSGGVPGTPEMSEEGGGRVLTPHGRWQVLHGLAKPDVRYGGDPELVPISDREVGWLVRLMYRLSCKVNDRFGPLLEQRYKEEGLKGELCRLVVESPCQFYRLEKSLDGAPPRRVYATHKPRISLRFIGSMRFLLYTFVVVLLFSLVSGTGLVGSSLSVLALAAAALLLRALANRILAGTNTKVNSLDSSLEHSKLE